MKRQAVNTITAHAAIAASAKSIDVPAHVPLDNEELPFWKSVIAEFARSEWTDHQLELAAMLARTMSSMESEQRYLKSEGSVLLSARGTPVVNPRKSIIQMHAGTVLAIRRSLSLHARAQNGEAEKIGPRRAQAKAVESHLDAINAADNVVSLLA